MPIYEYVCTVCKHDFENLARSMTERKPPPCPACKNNAVVRKLSVFSAREGESGLSCSPYSGDCGGCGDPTNRPCTM
ncbi:MAG: FmdB family zinc ribbon protein [Planctomycetota bacterium]|jgi:putative FmdB family regulatory protein